MKANVRSRVVASLAVGALLLVGGLDGAPTASASGPDGDAGPATVRTLARGAALHGANGLAFGPDGRLFVASTGGSEIVVLDPDSGRVLERIGPERGVQSPDDLAFGPDGALYWTSLTTGQVGRLAPDGTIVTVAHLPPGANPIAISDDGRLFVALAFLGDALYDLDPTGLASPRLIARDLGFLNGMDWGPDGRLYGPLMLKGQVVRVDVDAGALEIVADGFAFPSAVKFDARGELHVVDQLPGQVVRLDRTTGRKVTLATLTPGLDNLAFDARGRLFVSSNNDGFVVELRPHGDARTVIGGGMTSPGGVALRPSPDGGEQVVVADVANLRGFDGRTGRELFVERSVLGASPMTWPLTVAPDGENLLLTSWFGNAVQRWDPTARAVLEEHRDFAVPLNAVRFRRDLVVAELGAHRVVRVDAQTGARTTLAELAVPTGLAATADDLWVADWAAGAVWQLAAGGVPLAAPRHVATGLAAPEGLAVAPDGSLLVVEAGAGRLSRVDPATGAVGVVAIGLALGAPGFAGAPPTFVFNGVAVGPSGAVFVTGDRASVLYRIEPRPRPGLLRRAPPRSGR